MYQVQVPGINPSKLIFFIFDSWFILSSLLFVVSPHHFARAVFPHHQRQQKTNKINPAAKPHRGMYVFLNQIATDHGGENGPNAGKHAAKPHRRGTDRRVKRFRHMKHQHHPSDGLCKLHGPRHQQDPDFPRDHRQQDQCNTGSQKGSLQRNSSTCDTEWTWQPKQKKPTKKNKQHIKR